MVYFSNYTTRHNSLAHAGPVAKFYRTLLERLINFIEDLNVPVLVGDEVGEGRLGGLQDPETLESNLDNGLPVTALLGNLQR